MPDRADRLLALCLDPPAGDAEGVAAFRDLSTDPVGVTGTAATGSGRG